MKITKLSLAALAAMTLTTGAVAEVTNELSGNVKYWYETADTDNGGTNGLFHKSASGFTAGQAAVSVEAKGKAGVLGYGFKYTAVDTLGLEGNLVSTGRTSADGTVGTTAHWAEKAFITYKMGSTTAKVGRQHLNTPFVFTEAWNVAANSFDAAVLNTKLANVDLMGAYVGRGNGGNGSGPGFSSVQNNGQFGDLATDGAYILGLKAKPMKALSLNGYYYDFVSNTAIQNAYWLDANYAVNGIKLGALYASAEPEVGDSTNAFAIKAGTKAGPVSLFAAYSDVSDEGSHGISNVATGQKKTKLPTAGVYNDGVIVAQPGAKSFKVKAAMPVGSFKLVAQYVSASNDITQAKDVDEFDLIAATKVADVNVKAIFVNRSFRNSVGAGGTVGNTDSNHVRIIAGINF
ncbi:MAG: Unknown protein [uncultured Sulfurovum sp.]|uniref:Porin domain-containing protein n=1 Tax=uncultured Sulfurovum sp. TaxID=269237 RepID=A0A6S6TYJ6_9BACT|nr:MAG: Unknown protein [uncultured Sulfurovum sp.]